MISLALGTKVFLACRPIESASRVQWPGGEGAAGDRGKSFRRRSDIFRGKRGGYFKAIYWDGTGLWLLTKRLKKGRFAWPPIVDGEMMLTPAQLAVLVEGLQEYPLW